MMQVKMSSELSPQMDKSTDIASLAFFPSVHMLCLWRDYEGRFVNISFWKVMLLGEVIFGLINSFLVTNLMKSCSIIYTNRGAAVIENISHQLQELRQSEFWKYLQLSSLSSRAAEYILQLWNSWGKTV